MSIEKLIPNIIDNVDEARILEYIDSFGDLSIRDYRVIDDIDRRGWTLLHYAVSSGLHNLMVSLIIKGIDINAKDEAGWTPIHYAIDYDFVIATQDGGMPNDFPTARLLLRFGADNNIINKDGEYPIDILKEFEDMVELYGSILEEIQEIDGKNTK